MLNRNFPQLGVTWVKPHELTLYNRRARKHSKKKLKKLRALITEFGWTQPLIIDEVGMVLAGSGRLEVAIVDGIELVPVIRIDHMSEAQKRAYILADNAIAADASWDKAMLREELSGRYCQTKCTTVFQIGEAGLETIVCPVMSPI